MASCVLAIADRQYSYAPTLRSGVATLLYPTQYLIHLPVRWGNRIAEEWVSWARLVEDLRRLKTENLELRTVSQRFAALEAENARLRDLLASSLKVGDRVLAAELLSAPSGPDIRQITLNKGTQDGLYVGQPVLDAQGVMGQIVHVSPFTSTAMLLSDPTHALPVLINRTGVRAVAIGVGEERRLMLQYVPLNADVRRGDLIVSSGVGGFPSGYPVGEVLDVSPKPGDPFLQITVAPRANLAYANEVMLVWPGRGPLEIGQFSLTQPPAGPSNN